MYEGLDKKIIEWEKEKEECFDEEGTYYKNQFELLTSYFKFCGCVSDEIIIDTIRIIKCMSQHILYQGSIANKPNLDEKYVELVFCYLEGLDDIIEHGTSIRSSWLTKKGKDLVKKFERFFKEF